MTETERASHPRPPGDTHYLLGHTAHELRRLDIQGDLYRDTTIRAFREAGITAGMRVLDIGCGSGDVSVTVADVVGPTGYVLGIDRGAEAIATAREKADQRSLDHVQFEVSEISDFARPEEFDALVGRFVLMHQADPGAALRGAAQSVRDGGVVVMLESFMDLLLTGAHSEPHSPLYHELVHFKSEVVRGAGADLGAGGRLRATFLEAGLPEPACRLEARLEGGPDSPYYDYVEQSLRSMLPEARRIGLETYTEEDVEGMADRLRDEVVALRSSLVVWPVVAAWARIDRAAMG